MKDWFKKLWEKIKAFFVKCWGAIKEAFTKIWEWIKAVLKSVPYRYLYLALIGIIYTAIMGIDYPNAIEWPIVPVIFFCAIVMFAEMFCNKPVRWKDCLALLSGSLVIQVMFWCA